MWLFWFLGCQQGLPDGCDTGFELREDGRCYQSSDEPTSMANLLDDLGACEPLAPGTEIDFDLGCVAGLCPGMTLLELEAEASESAACTYDSLDYGEFTLTYVDCAFSNGVQASFSGTEDDVEPTETPADAIEIGPGFTGSGPTGVGIDASLLCAYDAFGLPSDVRFERTLTWNFKVTDLRYSTVAFVDSAFDDEGLDGLIDRIYFWP